MNFPKQFLNLRNIAFGMGFNEWDMDDKYIFSINQLNKLCSSAAHNRSREPYHDAPTAIANPLAIFPLYHF